VSARNRERERKRKLMGKCSHIFVKNWMTLMVLRLLVGIAEAFIQGAMLYLSFWYTYSELALRGAIFQSVSSVAGALNGLLCYGIAKDLDGVNGWRSWRWIFLVEGVRFLPTILQVNNLTLPQVIPIGFGFIVVIFLPSLPEKVRFGFTAAEKKLIVERTRRAHNAEESKVRLPLVWKALKDPKILLITLGGCGNYYALSSLQSFLPAIMTGLGYDGIKAQLMTVVVYSCAVVSIVFWGWYSDRTNRRGVSIMISTLFTAVGYLTILVVTDARLKLFAYCLLSFGAFPVMLLLLMWMVVNVISLTKRYVQIYRFVWWLICHPELLVSHCITWPDFCVG
jgi:MFS family permease